MLHRMHCLLPLLFISAAGAALGAATYEVGPGQPYTTLSSVPWAALGADDVVNVHCQPGGYHEKILISTQGAAGHPILIHGVPDPVTGAKPQIVGTNAVEAANINYRNTVFSTLGLVVISRRPTALYSQVPAYITFEGFDVGYAKGAFTNYLGQAAAFDTFASAIYAEVTQHLIIRDCDVHDSGNGLFINSKNDSLAEMSADILVEHCRFYQNSSAGSYGTHHCYTEAKGIVYQYNDFQPLVTGSGGQCIKDRSSGTVIRFNRFTTTNQVFTQTMHLVDTQGLTTIAADPAYKKTFVYGNVFDNTGPCDLMIYGGSQGNYALYRHGTLYFYNNTIVQRGGLGAGDTTLFTLPKYSETLGAPASEVVDCRNNIFASLPYNGVSASTFHLLYTDAGCAVNLGTNWISPGWVEGSPVVNSVYAGSVTGQNNLLVGASNGAPDPGFANLAAKDFHLLAGANAVNAAGAQAAATIGAYDVTMEFAAPANGSARPLFGSAMDLGAYESNVASGAANTLPQRGRFQFNFSRLQVSEGIGSVTVTITRSGGNQGAVSVPYNIAGSSASVTNPGDFIATNGIASWPDGDTTSRTFAIQIVNDAIIESNEDIYLFFGAPTGGATAANPSFATLTILDNDTPPPAGALQFSAATYSVNEGGGTATITVTRTGGSNGAVSVDYATSNGTANAPSDYSATNNTLSWASGDSSAKTFSIAINDDALVESNETINLTLTNAAGGAALGGTNSAVLTIIDNDSGPTAGTLQFSASTYSVNEGGGTVTISVTRSGGSSGAVSVTYATSNGTATSPSDYTTTTNTLSWANGDSSAKTFSVGINDDALVESSETINLSLTNATGGATLGGTSSAVLTIIDNDSPVTPDELLLGVSSTTSTLITFHSSTPGTLLSSVGVTGLVNFETLRALAVHPLTGVIYAVAAATVTNGGVVTVTSNHLYTIHPITAVATPLSAASFTPVLTHPSIDLAFEPGGAQLRVVVGTGAQNLRLNPTTGLVAAVDTTFAFVAGDIHASATPSLVGADFTRSNPTVGTLYAIDQTLDVLVRIGSLNGTPIAASSGQLTTIGALGVDTSGSTSLDISPATGSAFACLTLPSASQTGLYQINLSTGAATSLGTIGIGETLRDVVVAPPHVAWRFATFGANALLSSSNDTADFDHDGAVNAVEYALGMNPLAPDATLLPVAGTQSVGVATCQTLAFTRAAANVTYVVEVSGDLINWTPGNSYSPFGSALNTTATTDVTPNGSPPGYTVVRDNSQLGSATQHFMRLAISVP